MIDPRRPHAAVPHCLPPPDQTELPDFVDLPFVRQRIAQKARAERERPSDAAHQAPVRAITRRGEWSE